jgi:hypothetical protein
VRAWPIENAGFIRRGNGGIMEAVALVAQMA